MGASRRCEGKMSHKCHRGFIEASPGGSINKQTPVGAARLLQVIAMRTIGFAERFGRSFTRVRGDSGNVIKSAFCCILGVSGASCFGHADPVMDWPAIEVDVPRSSQEAWWAEEVSEPPPGRALAGHWRCAKQAASTEDQTTRPMAARGPCPGNASDTPDTPQARYDQARQEHITAEKRARWIGMTGRLQHWRLWMPSDFYRY